MPHLGASSYRDINITRGWVVAFSMTLLLLLSGAYLLQVPLRARYFFRELERLSLGHSTFEDAERLANKIHAEPEAYSPCNRSECIWARRIDNASLPLWWRGSGESFIVSFTVKDGLVVRKDTGYAIGIQGAELSQVELEEREQWDYLNLIGQVQARWQVTYWSQPVYQNSPELKSTGNYYWFHIRMTPKASLQDRRRYTAFNFNCLWKYKGCKDAMELMPTADPPPPADY